MYPNKCEEVCVDSNIYFGIIDDISSELNMINDKVSFISSGIPTGKEQNTLVRNELEAKLLRLLERTKEIRNSIIT